MADVIVRSDIDKVVSKARKMAGDKLQEFVDVAEETAVQNCPKLTGNLSRSIVSEKEGEADFKLFTTAGYGAYVELGTANRAGAFFLRNALVKASKEVRSA